MLDCISCIVLKTSYFKSAKRKYFLFFFFPNLFSFRAKKVPSVPESLLKKRQAYAALKAKRQKKILAIKKVIVSWLLNWNCSFAEISDTTADRVQYRSLQHLGLACWYFHNV